MFTERGFPFSHGEGLGPLIRHSCRRWTRGSLFSPSPCCEQKLSVVPFDSLTPPLARLYSKARGRRARKGSRNEGTEDTECRGRCLRPLQEPPWPPGPGLQEVTRSHPPLFPSKGKNDC